MSNLTRDVLLTIDDRLVWRPAKARDQPFDYVVQKAPSGRARCRKCSQLVEKGDLRCGIPIKHQCGTYGWISAWQHLSCTRIEDAKDIAKSIFGLGKLTSEEQTRVLREVTSSELPEHLRALDPDDLIKRGRLDEAEEPSALLRPLLPYQREGLGWMLRQEQGEVAGGILADEMGMGKTIQMVALLLAHRVPGPTLIVSPVSSMMQWETEIKEHVVPGALSVLVVYRTSKVTAEEMERADVVLTTYPMLEQAWRALINRIKVPCPYCGLLFIPRQLIVHNRYFCGPRARRTLKQQKREKHKSHAAAATSSDTHRNARVQSEATIRKGLRTLHVELDDAEDKATHDGADASTAQERRGVVGPMGMYEELMREAGRTVRSRWDAARRESSTSSESESEYTSESSSGSSASAPTASGPESGSESDAGAAPQSRSQATLQSFCCPQCGFQLLRYPFCPKTGQHHVLTEEMQAMIENDTGGDKVDLAASPFHSIRWARVVLDEAHRIKGRTTSTARSAFALTAEYRWCLTGTPLQNRVGDLYSLLRFLRMKPYSRYFCGTEGCSCSSLSHPFSGTSLHQCIFCGHGPVQHYAYFNRYILNPINRYGYIGDGRKGMIQLNNEVFSRAMLRRTKAERADDLHLPPLEVEVRKIVLTPEERNFYESLYKKSTAEFDTFVKKGTVLHNYAHIFQLLSRLRQALDHPLLVVQNMNVGGIVHAKGVCGICGEGLEGENVLTVSPCRHVYHRLCLSQFLESAPDQNYRCPTCFVKINIDLRQLRAEWDEEDSAGAAALPPELEEELNEPDELTAAEESDSMGRKEDVSETGKRRLKLKEEAVSESGSYSKRARKVAKREVRDAADDSTGVLIKAEEASECSTDDAHGAGRKRGRATVEDGRRGSPHSGAASSPPSSPKKVDRGILSRVDPDKPLHGTKLNAIADYVVSVPADEKVIIFSQFGDMLDLTQYWLQRRFVKSVKLCGSLTLTQRQAVLQAFLHDPTVRVILISLKAGGEGLNLQVANHVVLIDPWWNPAVEMQAVQRAHRIGQRKPVHAVRFETVNSVEERMIELQEKKLLVFEGTVDAKMQSLNKLTDQDLQFLFTR